MPTLEKSSDPRVVLVSSAGHAFGSDEFIRSARLERAEYSQIGSYGDAKLSNVLYAKQLAEKVSPELVFRFLSQNDVYVRFYSNAQATLKSIRN